MIFGTDRAKWILRGKTPTRRGHRAIRAEVLETRVAPALVAALPSGSQVYTESLSGEIESNVEADSFLLDLVAGNTVAIGVKPAASLAPAATLRDPHGVEMASATSADGEPTLIQSVAITESGQYELTMEGSGLSLGSYSIDVFYNAMAEDESFGGEDNSISLQSLAGPASFDEPDRLAVVGELSSTTDEDWFRFQSTPGEFISLAASSADRLGGFELELYDENSTLLAKGDSTASNAEWSIADFLNDAVKDPTTFLIRIVPTGARPTVDYTLLVTRDIAFDSEPNNDLGESAQTLLSGRAIGAAGTGPLLTFEIEPNNDNYYQVNRDDFPPANNLQGSFLPIAGDLYEVVVQGVIANVPGSDVDLFRISAEPGDELTITQVGDSLIDPFLRLFNGEGRPIATNDDTIGLDAQIAVELTDAGDYYIAADSHGTGTGSYTLTVALRTDHFHDEARDAYRYAVDEATTVNISASAIPAGHASNTLQPLLEVFDESGMLVTSGLDSVTYDPTASGTHAVVIRDANGGIGGEYALTVDGMTPVLISGPTATLRYPLNGSTISGSQPRVNLHFDQPLRLDSVDAEDVLIDGTPTVGFDVRSATYISFDAGPLIDGTHEITLVPGALTNLQGIGNQPLTASFTIDTAGPRVISSTLQDGALLSEGTLEATLFFDEPLHTFELDETDVRLTGTYQARTPDDFVYDDVDRAVTLRFDNLPDDSYELELTSSAFGFRDEWRNLLDGEFGDGTFPSGNGLEGGDFSLGFHVDMDTRIANPFQRLHPAGSMIVISERNRGAISGTNDIDAFETPVQAGQTLTIIAVPTEAAAMLTLEGPGGTIVQSPAPGEPAALPLEVVAADGTHRVEVSSDRATGYELLYFGNATYEVTDSTAASPLAIDGSRLDIGEGRYAAVGGLPIGNPGNTDSFTVDLTGVSGQSFELAFAALDGQGLEHTRVEVLDPTNALLASSTLNIFGDPERNEFDHRVRGSLTENGTYSVRVTGGSTGGRYGFVLLVGGGIEAEPNDLRTDNLRRLEPTVIGSLGDLPVNFAEQRMFVLDQYGGQLKEIDPRSGAVIHSIASPVDPSGRFAGLAIIGNRLFYYQIGQHTLFEIDADTGAVIDSIRTSELSLPITIDGLAAVGERILLLDSNQNRVDIFNPDTDQLEGFWRPEIRIIGGFAGAGSRGTVFAVGRDRRIHEFDHETGSLVQSLSLPPGFGLIEGMAFVNGKIYAATLDSPDYPLVAIDPDTGSVLDAIPIGYPVFAVAGDDAITASATAGANSIDDDHTDPQPLGAIPPRDFIAGAELDSNPSAGDKVQIAREFIAANADRFGLTDVTTDELILTDNYVSAHTGVTHLHFQQTYQGLPVVNSTVNVNILSDGAVAGAGGGVVRGLETVTKREVIAPELSAADALAALSNFFSWSHLGPVESAASAPAKNFRSMLRAEKIATQDIPVSLVYVPVAGGGVELAWSMNVDLRHDSHWYDAAVSAATGEVLFWADWSSHATYNVYPVPVESPNYGDRELVADPHDQIASPFGWHDVDGQPGAETTITFGNNVSAYLDRNEDDQPDSNSQPDGGGSLTFDFPLNLDQPPEAIQPAAVTNLFYWNNMLHDVLYQYGFDEAAGNFQFNNYGRGGVGGDPVKAEAQDGAEVGLRNNANFSTPPDGYAPRMQMFVWNRTNPQRDGDLDNGIIVHEYGHGLSNRLTGGSHDSTALWANQSRSMGEGWSDWLALMFSQSSEDLAAAARGIGTYALGQAPDGPGIRTQPYSFDMELNDLTYGRIGSQRIPHGAGEIWASVLWDLNWLLIEGSNLDPRLPPGLGFDPDLYRGTGGNNVAMQLVLDGMKLQPALPTFIQARDAILLADQLAYDGAHVEHIWLAFARRGMGYSADDGGHANSLRVKEAFDLPAMPAGEVYFDQDIYEVGGQVSVVLIDSDLIGQPTTTVTVSGARGDSEDVTLHTNGYGRFVGSLPIEAGSPIADGTLQAVRNEQLTVTYQDADDGTGVPTTVIDTAFATQVIEYYDADFSDDEGNPFDEGYRRSGTFNQWHLSTHRGYQPGHSFNDSFYFGEENTGAGPAYENDRFGLLESPVIDLTNAETPLTLSFNHFLSLEPGFDVANVSINRNGQIRTLLTSLDGSLPSETNGFQRRAVDISEYAGDEIKLRFWFNSNETNVREGWLVDDIRIESILHDPALVGPKITDYRVIRGEPSTAGILAFEFDFDEAPATASALNEAHYRLAHAGPNGVVEAGLGDDVAVPFTLELVTPTQVKLVVDPEYAGLAPGAYSATVVGHGPGSVLSDSDGNPLNGSFGPGSGSNFIGRAQAQVGIHGLDADRYTLSLEAGQQATFTTSTPFGPGEFNPANPDLVILRENGSIVGADNLSVGDSRNATYTLISRETRDYEIVVTAFGQAFGEYVLTTEISPAPAEVLDRHVFYNQSGYDGLEPDITSADDASFAEGVAALEPGGTGANENISSYARGLTGIGIDVGFLADPALISSADFTFRMGTDSDTSTWVTVPEPNAIEVVELSPGRHRIYLTWPEDTIINRWLQVKLLANEVTGLAEDDIFYFGSVPGDANRDGVVDAIDFLMTRLNPRGFLDPAGLADHHDINRDRRVNATDLVFIRDHATLASGFLAMIEPF